MCAKELDGTIWLKAVKCGASRLRTYKEEINSLNVFPIPDGDTGDNMFMTIDAGCASCTWSDSISTVAAAIASGALLGARGNSGVILSRIFSGLSKGLEDRVYCNTADFSSAMEKAVEEAYNSVSKPVEGTILTVLKDSVKVAGMSGADDFGKYFESLTTEMAQSLERTPNLLPVLKEAGVVDSGGAGLLCIMEGIRGAIDGGLSDEDLTGSVHDEEKALIPAKALDLDAFRPEDELKYGYCTEFLLRLQKSKVDLDNFNETLIRQHLESVGESVVCFREGSIVKVHVHTFRPGDILSACQQWGEFLTLKIENMALQHNEKISEAAESATSRFSKKEQIAVVTVAAGEGMRALFIEAGADAVIEGGQTMNPSVQSFLDAFDKVSAGHILVFPNNSNIMMTAKQAAGMYDKSDVRVIECRNQGAAYVAMASIDRSERDCDEILPEVEDMCNSVECGMVSQAIRSAIVCGKEIAPGDFLGISGSEIVCGSADRHSTALELCGKLDIGGRDVAIIFHGQEVPREEAEHLANALQAEFPAVEIILKDGGQPVYDYIFTLC